jgi:nucleotide sugar dehydrogenase
MSKPNILVIGVGTVGTNVARRLLLDSPVVEGNISVFVYDKYKETFAEKEDKHYDLAFICVDTPITEDTVCDTTEVKNALMENDAELFIIKSTVLPGTTEQLRKETGKHIIFSPEYYGGTQHCTNFKFNFTILGGFKTDCIKAIQILQQVYDATHQFRITDTKTAELVKYMENAFLATKVSFCNQFFDIAESAGVNYEELRELFILDPRVNPSHTFVYRDKPYWDSHCLNKDVAAIAEEYNAKLLKAIIDFNNSKKHPED